MIGILAASMSHIDIAMRGGALAMALALSILPARAFAEDHVEPTADASLATHPDGPGAGAVRVTLGASVEIAPTQVVEDELKYIPAIALETRVGLPRGLSVLADLETQLITTWLRAGPAYSFEAGPVGLMFGYLAVPWFGWLQQLGFDALAWGVSNVPVVRAGLHFGRVHVTVEVGVEISLSRRVRLESSVVDDADGITYLGTHAKLTVENELRNGGLLIYRVGLLAREGGAVVWPALLDETATLFYPRIEIAYAF